MSRIVRTGCLRTPAAWCFIASLLVTPPLFGQSSADGPTDHLRRAAALIDRGDFDAAERETRQAFADPVTEAAAWATLGTIRIRQGRLEEGIRCLEKGLQLDPALPGARLSLGLAFQMHGDTLRARQVFERLLQTDPNDANARFGLAQIEAEQGNYSTSLRLAEPILATLSGSPKGIYLLASDYLASGQKDDARALVKKWIALRPVPTTFSINFGSLLLQYDLSSEAIEVLENAKAVGPVSFDLVFRLAEGYWAADDLRSAVKNYEHALQLNPGCSTCCMRIAKSAEREADLERALAYVLKAKRLSPEDPDVIFEFGKVCLEKDLLADAVPALEKAFQLRRDDSQYAYVLAAAYVAKQRSNEALALLNHLLTGHPDDAMINYAIGSVLYTQGTNLDGAEAHLKKSITLQPRQVTAYYYLGRVYLAKGDQKQASEVFQDLLRRYPDHVPTLEQFGTLLLKQRDYAKAEQVLEQVLRLDQNSQIGHYQYGLLLGRLGRAEDGAMQIEIARQLEEEQRRNLKTELYLLNPQ